MGKEGNKEKTPTPNLIASSCVMVDTGQLGSHMRPYVSMNHTPNMHVPPQLTPHLQMLFNPYLHLDAVRGLLDKTGHRTRHSLLLLQNRICSSLDDRQRVQLRLDTRHQRRILSV